jgi:hypothetical protein
VTEPIGEAGVLIEVEESRIWFIDMWARHLDALKAYTNWGGCGQLEPLPLGIDSTNKVVLGRTTFICAHCYQGGVAYRIRRSHDPIGTYAGPVTLWGATGPVTEEGGQMDQEVESQRTQPESLEKRIMAQKGMEKAGIPNLDP